MRLLAFLRAGSLAQLSQPSRGHATVLPLAPHFAELHSVTVQCQAGVAFKVCSRLPDCAGRMSCKVVLRTVTPCCSVPGPTAIW
jgi:hypothetical protein